MGHKGCDSFQSQREEKVRKLKELIDKGEYVVNPQAVAKKLIGELWETTFY